MNHYADDRLAGRLADLEIAVPDRFVERVLARSATRATRRPVRLALAIPLAGLVVAASVAGGAYFAPRFGEAVADAPVMGGPAGALLRDAGLLQVSSRVATFTEAAASSGYQIKLLAGYADPTRTVLLLQVAPSSAGLLFSAPGSVVLSDQFGQRYQLRGGVADASRGVEALQFEPVGHLASAVGARLTLHVMELGRLEAPAVRGDWTLHAVLLVEPARSLPVPRPEGLGAVRVAFEDVRVAPGAVEVRLRVAGASAGGLGRTVPDALKGHPAFHMALSYPDGTDAQPVWTEIGSNGEVTALWLRAEPGPYRLTVSFEGVGQFERVLG
jgi:hypothetical protein